MKVEDFKWEEGMTVSELVEKLGRVGYQSIELERASRAIVNMKKGGAKIYLTFTSNMVTSGLRGFFAQIIDEGMADVVVTTVGGIEEDIMKATGEEFEIGSFDSDDIALNERGRNRVGNINIDNQSYMNFEDEINSFLEKIFEKHDRITPSELLREIGLMLDDEDSILYQAAKNDVPIFCPAITDGSFGFHLYLFQQKNPDFVVDVVKDFKNIVLSSSYDDKKGVIALGGGVSKHHAILASLLNGGLDYAVYITTARRHSGSIGGATTEEAKSWGKIKNSGDAATVIGDVSILFPLAMGKAMEELKKDGII